jgi:hypothetical membrane protein
MGTRHLTQLALPQHTADMQPGCVSRCLEALSARTLAWLVIGGIIVYVAVDVLLRFLRPEYSLIYNAESDYGRGPWYWVMDLNFLLRCALSLAACLALRRSAGPDSGVRAGVYLLATWAVCSGLLAFFADNPEGTPATASGIVHLILAFIAFASVVVGTILISAGLRSDPVWRPGATVLLAVALAGAAAFLLLGSAHGRHHAPGGLYERIFLGLELLWIALAAGYAAARPSEGRSSARLITSSAASGSPG